MRAADLLIQTLKKLDTKYIFSLSGNQIMPIYDACIDSGIQIIHVRHESAAVHMADAWGRLTGQPGVALIAGGPGFANGLSASYVAQIAESPVVVLSGHAALKTAGKMAFQEIDQITPALAVAKDAWMVTEPESIGFELEKAMALAAAGRPGPVHVSLPHDLLRAEVDEAKMAAQLADYPESQEISSSLFDKVKKAIGRAEHPLLLAGPAVLRKPSFQPAVQTLAEVGVPLIGLESPRGLDDPAGGTFGELIARADLIVLLGKKLDFTLNFGDTPYFSTQTELMHIDHDPAFLELTRNNGTHLNLTEVVQGNPSQLIEQLAAAPKAEITKDGAWLQQVNQTLAYRPAEWGALSGSDGTLHPVELGRAINGYLAKAEESIFISDGGQFCQWMQATISSTERILNGKSGSIGNAIPFAVAARLARPNAQIVACIGDGGFGFIPFEFDTAVRYSTPFTVVIGHDACWGAEHSIQLEHYGADRVYETELNATRYEQVVEILGGWGAHTADLVSVEEALRTAGDSGLPACINVPVESAVAPRYCRFE